MKTMVIGLGNPILGDDGVGWKVAEEVRKQLPCDMSVNVDCLSVGGISLMEHLIGYDRAILIDAFALEEPMPKATPKSRWTPCSAPAPASSRAGTSS